MQNAKHYVVINEWASDLESAIKVVCVAHSEEEARVQFQSALSAEREYALENGFEIYDDTTNVFDAGEDGFYATHHTRLFIEEV